MMTNPWMLVRDVLSQHTLTLSLDRVAMSHTRRAMIDIGSNKIIFFVVLLGLELVRLKPYNEDQFVDPSDGCFEPTYPYSLSLDRIAMSHTEIT